MPAYMVVLPSADASPGRTLVDGVDAMIVFAADATDAKAVAKAQTDGDVDALWDSATVTAIAAATDLIGWTFHVTLSSPAGVVVADCSVVGAGGDNTVDEIAALMVTALNATSAIAGAAYNSGSQVLKVAETTDNLGDHTVVAEWYPPNYAQPIAIPGLVVSKVDAGASGAAVSVTLAADAFVVPSVPVMFKSV